MSLHRKNCGPGLLWVALAAAVLALGCAGGGARDDTPNDPPARPAGSAGPFEPTRIEVHRLTRLERDPATGWWNVSAFVEMFDAYDDSVKGLGTLTVELLTPSGPLSGSEAQINRWVVDMRDARGNSAMYDRVTRAYRLVLTEAVREVDRGRVLALRATFVTNSGRRLTAQAPVAAAER